MIAARIQNRTMIFVSDHAFISKWWWIGAIRNTRRPRYLNDTTWMITDNAMTTYTPPISSSRNSAFIMIANPAIAPPSAIDPVSPIKTSAGKALYHRNPMAPPISAAPMIARSSFDKLRSSVRVDERMKAMIAIVVNVNSEMIAVPAASPSTPSLRLTAFDAPAITRKMNPYHAQLSGTNPMTGTYTDVKWGSPARF